MKHSFIAFILFSITMVWGQPPQNNNGLNGNSNSTILLENVNKENLLDSTVMESLDEVLIKKEEDKRMDKKAMSSKVSEYKMYRAKTKSNPSSRSLNSEDQKQLNEKAMEMQKMAPESEETQIIYYDAGNYNVEREQELKKALRSNPNNADALSLWLANSLVKGDSLEARETLAKMDELKLIPADIECFSEDLVASVPANTILVTHGKWDTYGFMQLQLNEQASKSILNVSLDFLQSPQYRAMLNSKGLILPSTIDVNPSYLAALCALNTSKIWVFSMTIPKEYLIQFQDQISPNGLTFIMNHPNFKLDFKSENERLFRSLHYMDCNQKQDPQYNGLLSNYLPMLIYLDERYNEVSSVSKKNDGLGPQNDVRVKKQQISNKLKQPSKKGN